MCFWYMVIPHFQYSDGTNPAGIRLLHSVYVIYEVCLRWDRYLLIIIPIPVTDAEPVVYLARGF